MPLSFNFNYNLVVNHGAGQFSEQTKYYTRVTILEFLGEVKGFSLYLGGVMVKLTKNVHKMVQKRPKPSFLMGGSPLFLPHLGMGPCIHPEI